MGQAQRALLLGWGPATRRVPGKGPGSPSAGAGFACLTGSSWQRAEVPAAAATARGGNAPSADRAGGAWGSIRGAGQLRRCAEQLQNAGGGAMPATAAPLRVQVVAGGAGEWLCAVI